MVRVYRMKKHFVTKMFFNQINSITARTKLIAAGNQRLKGLACMQPRFEGLECGRGDLMTINCKGRVSVAAPGTPVPLSIDRTVTASKLFFQAIPGLTGKTYVGIPAMTKATFTGDR